MKNPQFKLHIDQVGEYLRLYRGALYKKYPALTKRILTREERKILVSSSCFFFNRNCTIEILYLGEYGPLQTHSKKYDKSAASERGERHRER